jgi:hypothetical protein
MWRAVGAAIVEGFADSAGSDIMSGGEEVSLWELRQSRAQLRE